MPKKSDTPRKPDKPEKNATAAGTASATRKVVTRSPHRSVGIVACSWFQDAGIEYESQLERRFIQRALLFPGLKKIIHQPFKIDYTDQEKRREYTPDFLLVFEDESRLVIEVKPSVFVKKHLVKLHAAHRFLEAEHVPFAVATEKSIDAGVFAFNAALLLRYARGAINDASRQRCLDLFSSGPGPMTIGFVMERAGVSMDEIFHLLGRRILAVALDTKITATTPIALSIKESENAPIRFCNWINATPWSAASGISATSPEWSDPI